MCFIDYAKAIDCARWKSKGAIVNLKLKLLRSGIMAIATYSCESRAMKKNDEKDFEM